MRIANLSGRLTILTAEGTCDVETASNGSFHHNPQAIYDRWDEFLAWAHSVQPTTSADINSDDLRAPAPEPRQTFAVGLNYHAHAAESGHEAPTSFPPVFTKFTSAFSGPNTVVELPPGGNTDWEVELVVVIGKQARRVSEADAWSHVAGLTVGQDISERVSQLAGPVPQFSLGKSFPGFAPTGPWLVTVNEFADPDNLELSCEINGEVLQQGRTKDLIFPVPALIAHLSNVVALSPGDVIFTGTPAGVGLGREPQRFIQPGDELVSRIEGIGELRQRFIQAVPA